MHSTNLLANHNQSSFANFEFLVFGKLWSLYTGVNVAFTPTFIKS